MVLAFLQAEIDSERFPGQLARTLLRDQQHVVRQGDADDPIESLARRVILYSTRGYPDHWLFERWPVDAKWCRVVVTLDEIKAAHYLSDQPLWRDNKLPSPRLIGAAAPAVAELPANVPHVEAIRAGFRSGHSYGPLFFAACSASSDPDALTAEPLILFDGHARATVYSLEAEQDFTTAAFVGYSPSLPSWRWYADTS